MFIETDLDTNTISWCFSLSQMLTLTVVAGSCKVLVGQFQPCGRDMHSSVCCPISNHVFNNAGDIVSSETCVLFEMRTL